MVKVYTSSVVIIPPEDKWEPIQEIRRVYDKQIDRWMPHINLLYPFRPKKEFETLEEMFVNICRSIKPFEITLMDIDFFLHRHQKFTLWFSPNPMSDIKTLQKELLKIVPDCNDVNRYDVGYMPHLSIGQARSKGKMEQIRKELMLKWEPVSFLVDKIHFISRDKLTNTPFEIEKTIFLRG